MKVIGLIGGLSWKSSAEYYRIINSEVARRLGGFRSAKILMYSVDFAEIEPLQRSGDWERASELMIDAARRLERGGAEFFIICTNTMHIVAEQVAQSVSIPLIHIADPAGKAARDLGHSTVALLGTAFTMEKPFLRDRLERRFGLKVLVPEADERRDVHSIIYDELVRGDIREESRARYVEILERLGASGGQAAILGCTEIGMLVRPGDTSMPLFDTTALHAEAAVDYALGGVSGNWPEGSHA